MNRKTGIRVLIAIIFASLAPAFLQAADFSLEVPLRSGQDLDVVGKTVRRAITAHELAGSDSPPAKWTRVSLEQGESAQLGGNVFLHRRPAQDLEEAVVMVIGDDGPMQTSLMPGDERTVGPVRLIRLPGTTNGREIEFLVRSAGMPPVLADPPTDHESAVIVTGLNNPRRIVINGPNRNRVRFGAAVAEGLAEGAEAEEAARAAWEKFPPDARSLSRANSLLLPSGDTEAGDRPHTAAVTLQLIRAEVEALKGLSSSFGGNPFAGTSNDLHVSARTGAEGGSITFTDTSGAYRASLEALESKGEAHVSSETFVRVPIGGGASFSFRGPNGMVRGYLRAEPRGPHHVLLSIDDEAGDWSFLGSVSTTLVFRDGQTIMVTQNRDSRGERLRSGPPVLADVPYAGDLFGARIDKDRRTSMALLATVELE